MSLSLSPSVSILLSLWQPHPKNLWFFAISCSCYTFSGSVSLCIFTKYFPAWHAQPLVPLFFLDQQILQESLSLESLSWKPQNWAVCPVSSSIIHSFTVEHCNITVGWCVSFPCSFLYFLRAGTMLLYISVLTEPSYKSSWKKRRFQLRIYIGWISCILSWEGSLETSHTGLPCYFLSLNIHSHNGTLHDNENETRLELQATPWRRHADWCMYIPKAGFQKQALLNCIV